MLLVHVVGNADLGLETKADSGPRLACLSEADGEEAARLLGLLDGERSGTESWFRAESSPVRKALEAVRDRAKAAREGVEVLVIGGEGGRGPTGRMAKVILQALSRACDAGALAQVAGDDLRILDALILSNGLSPAPEDHDALRQAIGGHDGHVVLALGGGAAALLMAVAGAVVSTHPEDWLLLLTDRSQDGTGHPVVVDMSNDADARKGWFMGLGLPTLLRDDYRGDADVIAAIQHIDRACGAAGAAEPDDLALLLQCDTARGDLAAGLAARAWLVAEYRRRLEAYKAESEEHVGAADEDITDWTLDPDTGAERPLGKALSDIQRLEVTKRNPAEKWLLCQSDLNKFGAQATHDFQGDVDSSLAEQVRQAVGAPPDWLSWPSGRVTFLSAVGKPNSRPSMLRTLLDQTEVPSEIRQAVGTNGQLTLAAFLAHSNDERVSTHARSIRADASSASTAPEHWDFDNKHSTTHNYGASLTNNSTVAQTETSMRCIQDTARAWLENQEKFRAVVVGVVGEKPAQIALLMAAQEYGARHGVAVLLVSTRWSADRADEQPVFHQFGLAPNVRDRLLEATAYCLDRLDLRTAARLLSLGDPDMAALSAKAACLADDLVDARNCLEDDAHVATILDAMDHVASVIDGAQPDAQARLAVIIGELLVKRNKGVLKNCKEEREINVGSASREQMIGLLIWIRDHVTLTHGTGELRVVTEQCQHRAPGCTPVTYPEILRRVLACVPDYHPAAPNGWAARMRTLRCEVTKLRHHDGSNA